MEIDPGLAGVRRDDPVTTTGHATGHRPGSGLGSGNGSGNGPAPAVAAATALRAHGIPGVRLGDAEPRRGGGSGDGVHWRGLRRRGRWRVRRGVPPCVQLPAMQRSTVERRLSDAHQQLVRARTELAVLDEQLIVVDEMADDTRLQAVVSESPLAARDHGEASRTAAALRQTRDSLAGRITDLERRQDELLELLVVGPG